MAPWEVLDLVCHHLDPKSLAVASCVCKSWLISMSSDHLWKPICTSNFPSLSTLKITNPTVPYRRLYVIGCSAAKCRRQTPPKPRLLLDNLIFTINIFHHDNSSSNSLCTLAKPGNELTLDPNGIFKFDIDVDNHDAFEALEDEEAVRVTWNVVLEGWRGVFGMMENCKGKGGVEGWFSEELPSPRCCCGLSAVACSGIVADLKLGFCDGRRKVKKVSVGILSVVNWRYVSVDDALRYLQHFLLPCAV
ncbi:PREDICTED: probable F-box protein At5g04010 [Prunus mume]|uniref:F-box protein n=1 Tax=Prunus mume TaxID=102107 RepID=A0ABM0PK31_PRUMU|nr:PREDICTED: probable F-box protein At5g04010 [Prunus mume]